VPDPNVDELPPPNGDAVAPVPNEAVPNAGAGEPNTGGPPNTGVAVVGLLVPNDPKEDGEVLTAVPKTVGR